MSTDLNVLGKGLKRLGILVLLLIVSPLVLTMAFKALKKFTESPEIFIAYLLIALGGALIIFTIVFAFKTFRVLLNAFFQDS